MFSIKLFSSVESINPGNSHKRQSQPSPGTRDQRVNLNLMRVIQRDRSDSSMTVSESPCSWKLFSTPGFFFSKPQNFVLNDQAVTQHNEHVKR